ncbi:MAG: CBS domain-containing protein [Candidatus Omnitrophota bacterium]
MKVREVMSCEVKTVPAQMSVQEALQLLFKLEISGLPVVNELGVLAGMFTEKDVLNFILPSYIHKVGRFVYTENPKSIRNKFSQLDKIKVEKIMRREVVTINEDATLCEAARLMLTQKARRVPVVDKTRKISGIVARCDVLRALAKEAQVL